MLITQALLSGGLLSAILSLLIFASLAYNPRLWLHDAPQAMQDAVPPLTKREKRDRLLLSVPFFAVLILIPVLSVLSVEAALGRSLSFAEAFVHLYTVWMVFNLVDLLLLDWLVVVMWHPQRLQIPGTQHLIHLNSYADHFRGFLIGVVLGVVFSAVLGALLTVL